MKFYFSYWKILFAWIGKKTLNGQTITSLFRIIVKAVYS